MAPILAPEFLASTCLLCYNRFVVACMNVVRQSEGIFFSPVAVSGALLGTWVSVIAVNMHIGSVFARREASPLWPTHSGEEYFYGSETLRWQFAVQHC